MPVFTRLRDGVLEVIVDGDFTSGEFRRAGTTALESDGLTKPIPLLLDMSGAAGLRGPREDELRQTGVFLHEIVGSVGRVAVLAPPEAALFMEEAAEQAGLEARPFGTKADALGWLTGGGPG